MSTDANSGARQEILLRDREYLKINAVEDIASFDENEIRIKSALGMIAVDGSDLHILELSTDNGELEITGSIGSIIYYEISATAKKSGRLFKRRSGD